jgi:hypothetical protein
MSVGVVFAYHTYYPGLWEDLTPGFYLASTTEKQIFYPLAAWLLSW